MELASRLLDDGYLALGVLIVVLCLVVVVLVFDEDTCCDFCTIFVGSNVDGFA